MKDFNMILLYVWHNKSFRGISILTIGHFDFTVGCAWKIFYKKQKWTACSALMLNTKKFIPYKFNPYLVPLRRAPRRSAEKS